MMPYEFTLIDVGEGLEEAEIIEWYVRPGDTVVADQVVVSVETAKSVVELPIPVGGRIASICGEPGTVVPVGGVLATVTIEPESDDVPVSIKESAAPHDGAPRPDVVPEPVSGGPTAARQVMRTQASPLVRRLAKERGVDLNVVSASGPHGRLTRADLERYLTAASATSPHQSSAGGSSHETPKHQEQSTTSSIPFRGVRERIATVLTESIRTVPHIYDWRTANAAALVDLKRRLSGSQTHGKHIRLISLLARITLAGLRRHPIMNAKLDVTAGQIRLSPAVDLGLAISGPAGLVVPVLKNAETKNIIELDEELRRLTVGARDRTLKPADMARATFTVNNLGPLGADHGSPLLRVGEAGAVAFGVIRDGVVAQDGRAVVAPTMGITVVGDHRVLDGSDLCAFANTILRFIEQPDLLVTEL